MGYTDKGIPCPYKNKNTQKKIPELIRFEFETSGKTYTWIMEPNVDYEFQN